MKVKLLSLLLLCLSAKITAQNLLSRMGGRSTGMANATAAIADEWSLWSNPAGLASLTQLQVAFSVDVPADYIGAMKQAALVALPLPVGTMAFGTGKFGDPLYNEQNAVIAYSNSLGLASLAVRADLHQFHAEGFEPHRAVGLALGGIAAITPRLKVGAYIIGINQPRLYAEERLPARMHAGLLLTPLEAVSLCAEVEKTADLPTTIKGAFEYVVHKKIAIRTGFNLQPSTAFFGLGFRAWRIKVDYAIRYNDKLGLGQQLAAAVFTKTNRTKK